MSKINIEFDTVTKELSVVKDDMPVTDVSYVSIHRSYEENGKFSICLEREEKDLDNKSLTRTIIYASDNSQSVFAAAIAAKYGV